MRFAVAPLVLLTSALAQAAPPTTSCQFLEVGASTAKDPGIDPGLKPLEKKLKNPPFSSWNKFALLSHAEKTLEHMKPETVVLKSGKVTAIFLDQIGSSKIRLGLSIDDEHGKRTVNDTKVTVEAADWVIIGSSEPNNAGHLLALSCK